MLAFGPFQLDQQRRTITRDGVRLSLAAKAFDALAFLAKNPGQVVTKEELLAEVWRGVAVESNTVSQCISAVRKGLGDTAEEQRYIATVPGRGYSFVATIEEIDNAPAAARKRTPRWLIACLLLVIALGAAYWQIARMRANRPALPVTGSVQLTHELSEDTQPDLSPDGKLVAFVSNRDGHGDIWVMRVDGKDARNLTRNLGENDTPAWSPDGRRIAFQSSRLGGKPAIYVMNADGSDQRRVTQEPGSRAAWSPDTRRIAFQARRGAPHMGIYSIAADGSDEHRLTPSDVDCFDPAWSPDGGRIYHARLVGVDLQLFVMNADGSSPDRLPAAPRNNRVPAVSPDGTCIAFTSNRDGTDHIYVMDYDGANAIRLTSSAADESDPAWSADGRHIAYNSNVNGNAEVFVTAAPRPGAVRLTNHPAEDWYPAWSPDGSRIAFVTNRDGNPRIYMMDSARGHVQDLSRFAGDDAPAWSRDGSRIAFSSTRAGLRGVNLHTISQSRMSRSTRLKRKNRLKTCAKSSQKDRLPCAEARQSSAEAKVDPMNSSPSGTPSKIDIRLSFSDLGGTITRISLGKCFKKMRGLNRSKTSKYVEATTDSNAPSRSMRIVSITGPSPRCRPCPSAWELGTARVYRLHNGACQGFSQV